MDIFNQHRNLENCGDTTSAPCYSCFNEYGSKYCKYTKAFKMYKCCHNGDTEGVCSSTDPEVLCSDEFEGLLKYQVCYRESLSCGNEIVFVVNSTMQASTTEFFDYPDVCYFKVRTYEDNDNVIINVTFTNITRAEAYIIVKEVGMDSYYEERVDKGATENITYSYPRYKLKEKDIYVVAIAKGDGSTVTFETIR
jgi:hypothetical protein